jgi:membrane-bound lytic murein transglycosylase B
VATARAERAATEIMVARERLQSAGADRPSAIREEVARAKAVADERVAYEEARVLAQVEGVEFPLVALDAYYRAAAAVAEERPTCGVEWWALAGISRVEGRHGTYGGTRLMPNGDTDKRIIGIQLNGTNSTRVVRDTDGGRLDGDPSYDRAVGPMQFIPQTWQRFEADGNEDGTESPFNLYDATRAAATYLCTANSGLDADPGLRAAYFSYNHSLLYVDSVLGYARLYERSVEVPEREGSIPSR